MSASQFFITLLLIIDLICIIAVIFFERKNPTATVAWLLVLIFIPIVGVCAYIAFGSGFPARRKKRYIIKKTRDALYDSHLQNFLQIRPGKGLHNPHLFKRAIKYLTEEGNSIYTNQNQVELFAVGTEKFARLLEDIRSAKEHIHLLYYIFKNDQIGREIIEALAEKARQGVRVRVMYDGLGSIMGLSRMFAPLQKAGGTVRPFARLIFNLSPYIRINYRNHRKIVVVDGKIGYLGGMNIGDEYLGRNPKYNPWRDTHLRLTGPSVWFLQERFWMDWLHADQEDPEPKKLEKYFPEPLPGGSTGIQIASSGPDTAESTPIKSAFLQMLYDAEESILIQTPYFIPDDSFIDALRIAARSGVDVRLMLPRETDNPLVQPANLAYARDVLGHGVKVYLYKGFLHSKTITCDREMLSIGTTNMDIRSFSLNFEINAFIYDRKLALFHANLFEEDLKSCEQIDATWFAERSRFKTMLSKIARLFAPLM